MSDKIQTIDFLSPNAGKQFVDSLHHTGFAILHNHQIDFNLINDVYNDWETFFSSKEKHSYTFNPNTQDGYFPIGTENAKGYEAKDHKEFYHFYPWGRIPDTLTGATLELYNSLVSMTSILLEWIEIHTPKEIRSQFREPLKDMINGSKTNLFRIIHYPPFTGEEDNKSVRAAAHEDINLITLLVAGTGPGLEARDKDGTWHKIETDPDTIIINIGDMLEEASNGYYPSTTHRVVNPENYVANDSRYSMPLFLHPRNEVVLSDKYTAGKYLEERLQEIGLKN